MLILTPPPSAEPEAAVIRRARNALALAPTHPDAAEIEEALNIISDAWLRLAHLQRDISHTAAREAISCERYGMIGVLHDAISDLGYAVECWREANQRENGA